MTHMGYKEIGERNEIMHNLSAFYLSIGLIFRFIPVLNFLYTCIRR